MIPVTFIIVRSDGLQLPVYYSSKREASKALKFLNKDKRFNYRIESFIHERSTYENQEMPPLRKTRRSSQNASDWKP